MKKLLSLLLCAAFIVSLSACSGQGTPSGTSNQGSAPVITDEPTTAPTAEPTAVPFTSLDWNSVTPNAVTDFIYRTEEDGVIIAGYVGTNPVMFIPDSIDGKPVTGIAEYAFKDSAVITHAYLPDDVKYPDRGIFDNCTSLQQVRLPANLKMLDAYSFYGCSALRKVEMNDGLETIGEGAFMDCTALTEMNMPASVTSFKKLAFSGCTSLVSIYAPGLLFINDGALFDCCSLTALTVYAPGDISGHAFNGCTSLASIEVLPPPADCPTRFYIFENGVLYKTSHGAESVTAVRAMPGIIADEIVLREDTSIIDAYCFRDCRIKRAVIPAAVSRIISEAFGNCRELESVTVAQGSALWSIGYEVFKDCNSLKTVDFSAVSGTLDFGYSPFTFVYSLEKALLPDSVTADDPAESIFSSSKKVTVTYRGKDYTHDQLADLVFIE